MAMTKKPRCPNCKVESRQKYKKDFHPKLLKCYIRSSQDSNPLLHVGWFCDNCKSLFSKDCEELKK